MRKIVRVNGSNGVIYEEQMTEEQIRTFLHFVDLDDEDEKLVKRSVAHTFRLYGYASRVLLMGLGGCLLRRHASFFAVVNKEAKPPVFSPPTEHACL